MFYPSDEKQKIVDILKIDIVILSPFSIFVGDGYSQHADAKYLQHHNLRYHLYFVPYGMSLTHSIPFPYKWGIMIAKPGDGNRAEISDRIGLDGEVTFGCSST